MRRCAIYTRYSSDLQRESSIEDQVRRCREYAREKEWAVAENFVMADRALSAAAMAGREGLQRLLEGAQGKPRPFDCLLIEDTSRLARDLADALRTTAILEFHGVAVVSVTQGIDSSQVNARQLITLHGMVDEQYLTGLRDKVHRGQHGRVLNGMIPGGRCYGYRNIPIEDPSRQGKYGRFAVLGVRAEIDEKEAKVVIWIFELYAGGLGLAQIAKGLNQLGIPSPIPAKNRLRRAWSRYTIREMLHNERYRGVLVWDRTKKVRNPETGRKISRARPESEWTRVEVPAMRIVAEELWNAVRAKNAEVNALRIAHLGGLCRTQSSRTYLFSGILVCGRCGSSIVIVSGGGKRGYVKYGCHSHKHNGVCDNNWTIRRDRLEEQLLGAIKEKVLRPSIIDYLVLRCEEELKRRVAEMESKRSGSNLDGLRGRREELLERAKRLAQAIETGGELRSLTERLREIENQIAGLDRTMAEFRPLNLNTTADVIRERIRSGVMHLREVVAASDPAAAKNALRKHVRRLVLTPAVQNGHRLFKVSGSVDLAPDQDTCGMLWL